MTTVTQTITTLPAAPDPASDSPATFSTKAAAYVLAQKSMVPELNTWASQVNTVAGEVSTNAISLSGSAAVALAASNFKGLWTAQLGAAAVPYSVVHLSKYWQLTSNITDVTVKVPGTATEWVEIRTGASSWLRKTTTYAAASGDRIRASTTAGAWSCTFPASPADGDEIEIIDIDGTFNTNNLTLLVNGKKIMGYTTSWVLNTRYAHLLFVYDSTLGDWRI